MKTALLAPGTSVCAACLWLILWLTGPLVWSQEPTHCATPMTHDPWLRTYHADHALKARSGNMPVYLPISFHLLGTDMGEGHYNTLKLYESLCQLNTDFSDYEIQFYQAGEIDKINRSRFYDHDNFGDGARMMNTYNRDRAINVYITNSAPDNACGYWLQAPDAIVVIKDCMGANGHTLTHEVGHYLSLLHPFNGWEGKTYDANMPTPLFHGVFGRDTLFIESVSGRNCQKAGDFICDTGPDYLSLSWQCDGNSLSLQKQVDPFGIDFRSDGTNFMSYSVDACQARFTPQQVQAMHDFIPDRKAFLLDLAPIEPATSKDPIKNMQPNNGDQVEHQSIVLSWDQVPNATQYLIQISRFSFFAVIDYEFMATDHVVNIGDLPVDKEYYWRVLPLNDYDHCGSFSVAEGGFETVFSTNSYAFDDHNTLFVYPTLLDDRSSQITLDLDFSSATYLDIQLVDLHGHQLIHKLILHPGQGTTTFELDHLPSGAYFLRLRTNLGISTVRIFRQ